MRCNICRRPAGWWRRRCAACTTLWALYVARPEGSALPDLLAAFEATGHSQGEISAFLSADPRGAGSIQDELAAEMTNQLLGALGRNHRQTASEVKRLRQRGSWKSYDRPPE